MGYNEILDELITKLDTLLSTQRNVFARDMNTDGIKAVDELLERIKANEDKEKKIVSVPQFIGYDNSNRPVYTYSQMKLLGHDPTGQPVFIPYAGQTLPPTDMAFSAPDGRLTPGQKIAAAFAAKAANEPVKANISQIATHQHNRSTAQAFISAISESKEHKDESLTETQGLHTRTKVHNSVEDVLSELGDNSAKKRAEEIQRSTPTYEEYRPSEQTSRPAPRRRTVQSSESALTSMPMSKAEIKAKKKQEKIDAKFHRDMQKRGLK